MRTLFPLRVPVWLLVLGLGTPIYAGVSDSTKIPERVVPEIQAYRVNPHAPVIDGNLNDSVWASSKLQKVGQFTQTDPDEGKPPTESTLVAVAYDENALYVAFWCYDSQPDKVVRQLVRRDRSSTSDAVSLRLDAYHDHQTGFVFTVYAAGNQRDLRVYNNTNTDESWDGVWNSAVREQPWGWSAEIAIPYHCLRFPEQAEHTWGIDFIRVIGRRNEWQDWAFVPSKVGGLASNFGHLTGLTGIEPKRHLEVMPYAVSDLETRPSSRWVDGKDVFGNTGVDVKYGLSSSLTLDATINPDFGQVELDQPVLNLSTYETWFSEKRPFFIEGSDLFQTDFTLFYSRRIGREPAFQVKDPRKFKELERPRASTILGAAKLAGKIGDRTSIAVLAAVTDLEKSRYVDTVVHRQGQLIPDDTTFSFHSGVVEPQAGYTVVRVKRDFFARSSVGLMMTVASQDTRYPAVTGGGDWRLYTNDGKWFVSGQSIFSRAIPDHTGFGLSMNVGKDAGEHVLGQVSLTIEDPHLNINRLGYIPRNNRRAGGAWVQYRTTDDWWIIRNSYNNFNFWYEKNYAGVEISKSGNWNLNLDFTNNWYLGCGASIQAEKYSDVETRGHGIWQWPVVPTYSWWFSLNTDPRRMFSFTLNPGSGGDRGGLWWANYVGVNFRPRSNMEFSLGTNYTRNFHVTRWVDNPDDTTTIFADLDRDEISLSASAGIMFTRNLSCQLSAEGLLSGLDYRNYRPYLGNNEYGPEGSWPVGTYPPGTYPNNDYNLGALNSTFLIRWEYRPGSTIYVVWTRSKSDSDSRRNHLELKKDLERFFSAGSENLFLVKASYWMNI